MKNKNVYSVKEYFEKGTYVIPYYQRGYKWSLGGKGKTSLDILLKDLKNAFIQTPDHDYHLQGITVQKEESKYILVDGQQRTTSLFLILLCLKVNHEVEIDGLIGDKKNPQLEYKVRESVEDWIKNKYSTEGTQPNNAKEQDIAALEKAWEMITQFFNKTDETSSDFVDHKKFAAFVLEKVKLIFVVLNTNPEKVFSMMNKDKAVMTQTDLVKAKLLSEASRQAFADLDTHEEGEHEWQINHLRSHFAREWDSWRKWWEQRKEERFFGNAISHFDSEPENSRLLRLYWFCENPDKKQEDLKRANLLNEYTEFITDSDQSDGNLRIEAVETFEGLRLIQKIIEEWYDDPVIYNWLGLMKFGSSQRFDLKSISKLIMEYKNVRNEIPFYEWYRDNSLPESGIESALQQLKREVYGENYELAAQQLLRRNVLMLSGFGLKFDFSMYEPDENAAQRSLEHIYPQSKFSNENGVSSVEGNSIGNLALIPKGLNSSLNDKDFFLKKPMVMEAFLDNKKRKMALFMHSLKLFSEEKWEKNEVEKNRDEFISECEAFYKQAGV